MATYDGAIYQASDAINGVQAVHENAKVVSRHGRFSAFGHAVARLVRGLTVEVGRLLRVALFAGIVGGAAGFGLIMLGYPDPVVGLKHFAAAPHCAFAERLGVAHAKYGQPGYWKHHDTDGNGVACE